ncbi:MAG: CHASE2 domain-containing protein [Gammaproteobacteria bacterium]
MALHLNNKSVQLLMFLALIAADFFLLGGLNIAEHPVQDLLVGMHADTRPPDPDVMVVNVSDPSLLELQKNLNAGWPLPRSLYAQLVEGLLKQNPRAIVFDIYFVDPDTQRPDDDKYLIDVTASSDKVFFPITRLEGSDDSKAAPFSAYPPQIGFKATAGADPNAQAAFLFPLPKLARTGRLGDINFLQDADKVGRRYYTYYAVKGWRVPSLPVKVATALGYTAPDTPSFLLNWRKGVRRVPFYDIYEDVQRRNPLRPADEFTNKIVIIGTNAAGLGDAHPTPIGASYAGVDILATALSNLRNHDWLKRVPAWAGAGLSALLVLVVWGLFVRSFGVFRTASVLVVLTAIMVVSAYGMLSARWMMPVVQPALFAWLFFISMALTEYLRERKERLHAIGMFGRFLDPRVVADLVKDQREFLAEEPMSREVTVMFSDIRGFTTLSETRTPEQVVSILNRYFSLQVAVIRRHGGTTDKFIGDCIMAFWGAPVPDEEQARHAVAAALEMAQVLLEFRKDLGDLSETFDIGIGIHTGQAVVGFMGSENKLDYTAIGDSVNLASRIEGQTKGVARVLISAATRDRCGDAFDFTDRGTYKVKGREQPVQLFEPGEK